MKYSVPVELEWIKEGDKFKRPTDTIIQVIEEVLIEDGDVCVHHHDLGDENSGWCSSIFSFEPEFKIE